MWPRLLSGLRNAEMTLACVLMLVLVAVVIIGSGSRYLGQPFLSSEEIAQGIFVWLCVLAADLTLQRRGHFRVDLLTSLLPKPLRQVWEVITLLTIAALLAFLAWKGVQFSMITHDRAMPMTRLPSSVFNGALAVGFMLMLITIVEQIQGILSGRTDVDGSSAREVM